MKSSFWPRLPLMYNSPAKKTVAWCLFVLSLLVAQTAQAAYFVDNAASGCTNGSKTYNPANRTCSGGSDTVYTSLNNANWAVPAGSSGSQTVINIRSGTYKEQLGITKNYTRWQKYPGDGSKPVIDGEWVRPSIYSGLINANGISGVTIDGIYFTRAAYNQNGVTKYSQANAIRIDYSYNTTIQNCDFYYIGDSAIMMIYGYSGHVIQDNYIHQSGYSIKEGSWSPSIALHRNITNSTVRRNTFYGIWNEGISTDEDCRNNVIEYNTIIDCSRIAIYLTSSTYETIRYNLIYHTHTNSQYEGGAWGNLGIWISGENPYYTNANKGHRIYGNLVAGTSVAMGFEGHTSYCPSCIQNDIKVYNNTFVESVRKAGDWGEVPTLLLVNGGDVIGTGIEVRNNIFWQTSGNLADVGQGPGITFANNLWSKSPPSNVRSSSDPTAAAGYPTLNISNYFSKTAGWTSLSPNSLTGQEFALRSTAAYAIGKGGNLGTGYESKVLDLDASNYLSQVFSLTDQDSIGADAFGNPVAKLSPPSMPRIETVQN